jgi:hypothetical protein
MEGINMNIGNIKDLAPTFIENYTDETVPRTVYKKYEDKIENNKKHIGTASKYFFGHLHDSDILSIKNNKGNLYLKLNEMATLEFACALIDKLKLKINKSKIIFPLEIVSENTSHLSLNVVDTNGKIYENEFIGLNEYLFEEIIEWTEENIKIAFDLWSSKIKYGIDGIERNRYLLLLSCKKLTVNEMQHEYWNKYFGTEYDKYYNTFLDSLINACNIALEKKLELICSGE